MRRRDLIAALGGAVAIVLAGGVARAAIPSDGGVYTACMLKNVGTVRLIDKSLPPGNLMSHCNPALEIEVSWNKQGQQGIQGPPGQAGADGDDGVSPSVTQLAAGDTNCPAGGASITDAAGTTAYVCSGQDGADGEPFSGTFTSPSGEYSISVTNAGIVIGRGSTNSITVAGEDLAVRTRDLGMQSDRNMTVQAGGTATLDSQGNLTLRTSGSGLVRASNRLDLQGSVVQIN